MQVHHFILTALVAIVIYELVRARLLGFAREALHRRARRFADAHNVRVDLFKFGGRLLVKEELLNDLVVHQAMLAASQGLLPRKRPDGTIGPGTPERPEEVRKRVEEYIDEIVPAFSLSAYYQFGMKLAAAAVRAVYRPVIDQRSLERVRNLPPNTTAVFLINHRSNFDYVVVGWALARQVAISYAVGEWARVFPLDALFKAFGGFFVRRGFPDPLYHTVLRRYLQLITRNGVTQGIFPEGGLTRDGALRAPKVGLLDALLQLTAEPGYDRELTFVPVGINYDRVLEDTSLLGERRGKANPPSVAEKLRGALRLLWVLPSRLIINLLRAATGRLHRAGYVSVAFGDPVRWSELAKEKHIELAKLSDAQRRAAAKEVAMELMKHIAKAIPATPVPLVARAMLQLQDTSLARLAEAVRDLRRELEALGVTVALGSEFDRHRQSRDALEIDEERNRDLARMEGDLLVLEEAEAISKLGVELLARRKLLRRDGHHITVVAGDEQRELLEYYSKSLAVLDLAGVELAGSVKLEARS